MKLYVWYLLGSLWSMLQPAHADILHTGRVLSLADPTPVSIPSPTTFITNYNKTLQFRIYQFSVTAIDTGRVRTAYVKAYRGTALLTSFQVKVDGVIAGAEVADLDKNGFPELYIYSTSDGSGSFGRVYAWQFLPERKADIAIPNWRLTANGYMGHDSLWIEQTILCRKFPVYQSGDANAEPSGGFQMVRYQLKPQGTGYVLESIVDSR